MKRILYLAFLLIVPAVFSSEQILEAGKYEVVDYFGFNSKQEIEILEGNKIHVTDTTYGCMVQDDGSVHTWVHEYFGSIKRNERGKVIFTFQGERTPSPFDWEFRRVSKNKITSKREWRQTIRRIKER